MLRIKTGLLASILFFLAHSLAAQADTSFSKGLFWQIKTPKGQVSWLVGSIHVGDERVESRIVAAEKLLGAAQRLVLEMDKQELQKAAQMMKSSQDTPFSDEMPKEIAIRVRTAMLARGIAGAQIDRTPRWLAIFMLATPAGARPGMNERLMQKMQASRRPVFGLESAHEQLDTIRGLPAEVQTAILTWQVTRNDESGADLARMIDAYASENLARLIDLEFESSAPDSLSAEQQALVLDRLINQRNIIMVERMQPHLKAGKALLAVGAVHLPGVLHELDALGYTVERMEM